MGTVQNSTNNFGSSLEVTRVLQDGGAGVHMNASLRGTEEERTVALAHAITCAMRSAPSFLRAPPHGMRSSRLAPVPAARLGSSHVLSALGADPSFFPAELQGVLASGGSRSASGSRRSGLASSADLGDFRRTASLARIEDEERTSGAPSGPPSRAVSPLAVFGADAALFDPLAEVPGEDDLRNSFDDDGEPGAENDAASDADDGDYGVAYGSDNDDIGGFSDGGGADEY